MGLIPLGFWAASGAGGGSTGDPFELITTTVLGSSAASVTFSGLGTSAAAYKHLQLRITARSDSSGVEYGQGYMRFNGDSGSNYAVHFLIGGGSSVSTYSAANDVAGVGVVHAGNSAAASMFSANVIDLLDFSNTSKTKTMRSLIGASLGSTKQIRFASTLWNSTAAVTSMAFYPESGNFVTGSRFSLYGLRG